MLALFATLLASQAAGAAQPTPLKQESWINSDDYPNPARRAGEEGRVEYRLDVDATGAVTNCSIVTSSGSGVLDVHTCDLMRLRARFEPAHDARNHAIPSEYTSSVTWTLPVGPAVEVGGAEVDRTTIDVAVGSDGRVTGCTVVELVGSASDPTSLSPCVKYPVGSRYSDPTTRNGRPVGSRVRITDSEMREYGQR